MRPVVCALVALGACGGPVLKNAPRPDPGAVAGVAAAAAAAITLADPNAATRGKPEQPVEEQDKAPIEVKQHVTSDVLDRLDDGSGSATAAPAPAAAAKPAAHRRGRVPTLPTPAQAAAQANGP